MPNNNPFHLLPKLSLIILFLISAIITIPISSAIMTSDSAILNLKLEIPVSFETTPNSTFMYLDVDFVMIPSDDSRQRVISSRFSPPPLSVDEEVAKFQITSTDNTIIKSEFLVETSSFSTPVTSKVNFPLENLDPVYLPYLLSSDVFDINNDIRSLATDLSQGNDDLFKVVFSISKWVNENVEYDLDTMSSQTLSASWVLDNRKGVCTEYSSLMVALLRSIGIPSREVSGVAFTDSSLFPTDWGFHSWVEVYFPGHGWVSFDPTYGQHGYIDAGHIKLNVDAERAGKNSFSWRGRDVEVIPGETILDVEIISLNNDVASSKLSAKTSVLEKVVGQDSYNFLKIDLTNNNNYYIAETLRVTGVDGLQFISPRSQSVALAPGESVSIYIIFKVSRNLDEGFIYTFPLRFHLNGEPFSSEIKAQKGGIIIPEEDVLIFQDEEKVLVPGLACSTESVARVNDFLLIECESLNEEGILCFDKNCVMVNGNMSVSTLQAEPGIFTKPVLFESYSGSLRLAYVNYLVIDDASISLSGTVHSSILEPSHNGFLNVSLKKDSSSIPKNVKLSIHHDYFTEEIYVGDVDGEFIFNLQFPARNLKKGTNQLMINTTFFDVLGKEFSENSIVEINVEKLSLLDEIDFFFRKVYFWLKNLW
jgi:transglutaminase-like putative cysteine protease